MRSLRPAVGRATLDALVSASGPLGTFVNTLCRELQSREQDRLASVIALVRDEMKGEEPVVNVAQRDLEKWIRSVMEESDERKQPLFAQLLTNALKGTLPPAFDLWTLIRCMVDLSYEALVLLCYIGTETVTKRTVNYRDERVAQDSKVAIWLYRAHDLCQRELIAVPNVHVLGLTDFVPSAAELQGIGRCICEMAGIVRLQNVPEFSEVSLLLSK